MVGRRRQLDFRLRHWVLLAFVCLGGMVLAGPARGAPPPLQVEIAGIEGEAQENVAAALEPPPGLAGPGVIDRNWLDRFVAQVPDRVDQALRPFGFYRSTARVELQVVAADRYLLQVQVTPGSAVRVAGRDVRVAGDGAAEAELQQLVRDFPLATGSILRQDIYEAAKGALKSKALDLGYLDADFSTHSIVIDSSMTSGDIALRLETGPRYRFGPVFITTDKSFPEPYLLRHLDFAEGDVFSFQRLARTQLNLLNTDRFRDAVVNPRKDLARGLAVPVTIQLTANPRHRLRPGVGYGTDTGLRFSLRYQNLNVFHLAHEFRTDLDVAERRQALNFKYTLPDPAHLDSETQLKLGLIREDPESYESRAYFVEGERLWGFGQSRIGSVYLRFQQEDYIVGTQHDRARLVLPGLRWRAAFLDDPLAPRSGYHYRLEVRGTDQLLGSDTSLLQLLWGGNVLLPLPARFALLLRTEGGSTWQDDPLSEVPASMRFFAGGDRSVRGYAYNSLGPVDAQGKVLGGRHLLAGSAELEYALTKNWGVAAFYDVGNAFDSWVDFELRESLGGGIRRKTVIGPVKVDLARQLHVPDPSWRLHVTIGFGW